jgi:hypothetical protein
MEENDSFNLPFRYINGENKAGLRIPMTAPVVSRTREPLDPDSEGRLSFVLSGDVKFEEAPQAKDPRVVLEKKEGGFFAVMRFRGRAGQDELQKMAHELLSELREADFDVDGRPFLLRYNSPFTLGFMRRNEVAVRVAPIEMKKRP